MGAVGVRGVVRAGRAMGVMGVVGGITKNFGKV